MSRIAPLRRWGIDSLTMEMRTFWVVAMMSMSWSNDHVLVERVPPLFAMMRYLCLLYASAFLRNILLAFAIHDFKLDTQRLIATGEVGLVDHRNCLAFLIGANHLVESN